MATSSQALQRLPNRLPIEATRPGLCDRAGSGQTAAGSIRFRDAYQWKKKPVLAETDSETELDPTPWTLVVWVNVSLCELYPSASAVALAIAELP
jgi:hypothetical protein